MKLRTQIIGFGLAGALLVGLSGGIGIYASSRMGESIHAATQSTQAMAAGLEADMMHDAVRGDAQLALLGAMEGSAEKLATARDGFEDHIETFKTALDRIGSLPIGDASRKTLDATRPEVDRYIAAGSAMIAAATISAAAGQAEAQAFQKAFSDLEARMATLQAEGTQLEGHLCQSPPPSDFANQGKRLKAVNEELQTLEEQWLEVSSEIESA